MNVLDEINKFKDKPINHKRNTWTPNDIIIYNDYAEVILRSKNQEINGICLIDLDNVNLIKNYKWRNLKGRVATSLVINGHRYSSFKMSRLIMGCKEYDGIIQVDHINHNPLDNRKSNLRKVTLTENQRNKTPINKRPRTILKIKD